MKISPMASVTVPAGDPVNPPQSRVDIMRKMRMNTNVTPALSQQVIPPELTELSTPDTNNSPEPAADTQPLSPQLALLAKQRRALQIKERELAEREKVYLSKSTGTPTIDVNRLKSEPMKVLLENGVTYEQLTQEILAGDGNSEFNTLKSEFESLKQGVDQRFLDKDTQAEKQVLAEMRREAELLAKDDEYELVRETKNIPNVMKLIERTYKETGEILDVTEALKLVEEELFKDAQKMTRFKKLQSLVAPPPVPPQTRQQGMRTLTNKDTASVPLSARARALAAFYGTLPKG